MKTFDEHWKETWVAACPTTPKILEMAFREVAERAWNAAMAEIKKEIEQEFESARSLGNPYPTNNMASSQPVQDWKHHLEENLVRVVHPVAYRSKPE